MEQSFFVHSYISVDDDHIHWVYFILEQPFKQAMRSILEEYQIKTAKDWYDQDEEKGLELYENLKAGVMEEYDLNDDQMGELLDEVLGSEA